MESKLEMKTFDEVNIFNRLFGFIAFGKVKNKKAIIEFVRVS